MDEEILSSIFPAFVCNVKDDEERGRIKVTCPEVFGDNETESAWCEPCVDVGYDYSGDFCVPKLGEGVWITFINGEIDRPVYLGGWWGEKASPLDSTYEEDVETTRIISYDGCRIKMVEGQIIIDFEDNENKIIIDNENNSIEFNGDITINGNIKVIGNVETTGDTKTTGTSTISGDAKIGGKSFLGHTHTGVHGGTSAPN